ncbi:hypothetical protein Bca52824_021512 [Brassica carinata]|uniref:Uncharacterized protein n=1 Tax=Brassica carinata TaxID=52824 RepID=A0A8X8AQ88_BRACI|nr:hypothetical protein Bca52824_021512 [Brassica carinata]
MVKKITEEEEVTEVVEVSSRKVSSQLEFSSGRPGESQNDEVIAESLEVASTQEESQQPKDEVADANGEGEAEEENQENGEEDKQVDEQKEDEEEDKKKPARGGGKRKRATKKEIEVKDEKKKKAAAPRAKKARVSKPQEEPEYFEDERNLEGLWKAAFPVGTEPTGSTGGGRWIALWKKVFLLVVQNIGITSVQREVEEIIPMKTMKMDWPYIPVDKALYYPIICRAALRHMKEDLVKKYEYCLLVNFYQPFKEEELEQSTEVQIMFPEPPVIFIKRVLCMFLEFVDKLIEEEALTAEQKDEFKEYVKEQVRAAKKANREAREARRKAIEEMSEETKQAFQSMKFYKFYLCFTRNTRCLWRQVAVHQQILWKGSRSPIIIKS